MNRRTPDYKKYVRQKIEILKQETNLIRPLVTAHSSTVGVFYEMILKKFVRDFVPNRYKVGTGFVMDIENNSLSRQIDILIYEDDAFAPIYQDQDFLIVESCAVSVAIEVKASIDSTTVKDAKKNMESFREVTYPFTYWYLIGINRTNEKQTLLRYYEDLGKCQGLLVLDEYYIEGGKVFPKNKEATPATEVFLNNLLYHLIMYPTERPRPEIVEYR